MRRRTCLTLSGAAIAGLAGCMTPSLAPSSGNSRFDDVPCPTVGSGARSGVEGSVCYHEAGSDVYLEPSSQSVECDGGDGIEFTLVNGSGGSITVDPTAWGVLHWRDDRWEEYFGPEVYDRIAVTVGPGEGYTWRVNFEEWNRIRDEKRELDLAVESPGVYAFEVAATDRSGGAEYVHVAMFECVE